NKGPLGVFWHTQGSGKSYSMVFFAQYVIRRVPGNWTFVIVTDRNELDDQIYKTFANSGLILEKQAQAESGDHLKNLLTEDHRFVFTLIQKFQARDGGKYPMLSDRSDIIVMTDEAHRSQYDSLAMNMRRALPNASFIGFTGTPLMAGEEKTRQVFGDYVSIYNFKQSVDDGATVPLYYDNRIPELQLTNEQLNEDMAALLEAAELDEEQEKKLERTFAKEYHLITRDERLETIAKDLVQHFMGRGVMGKAMVVCIDRYTAVRMHDKVKKHWKAYYDDLRKRIGAGAEDLIERAKFMKEADMAVIVSSSQNEQEDFAKKGLDILSHRKRMAKEDLETKFKDENDPLRIVFVCAMWITGFDVPCCSTIYLDKPMKNHTLMQTIARANRTFPEKNNGLIVDYVGIFRNLQKALAIYGSDTGGGIKPGENPVHDKKELVAMLKAVVSETETFCKQHKVNIPAAAEETRVFERTALIADAVEKLVYPEDNKKEFLRKVGLVVRIHKAVMPDPVAHDFDSVRRVLEAIAANLRPLPEEVDISEVMEAIEMLLDRSVATKGYRIQEKPNEGDEFKAGIIDLSKIDFKSLKTHFDKGQKRTVIERLRAVIEQRLLAMVRLNQSRLDYLQKFQQMIEEYNSGSKNIEQFFKELTEFVKELDDEERRGIQEGLSDEELALFDILTKPEMKMTVKERAAVKKVVQALLQRLKSEKLVLDWKKRQQSRADVRLAIEKKLDELPRTYTREIYARKCDLVYQHIFESYKDAGHSVYAEAG
ncbi:MAG: type I restriction endonuclease subunit R, partial [Lentisphaerae bacterium]|nr:type I restriction endonuclease subunit R [Lentisphaerota bacterium]